jgi:hypothetical protein
MGCSLGVEPSDRETQSRAYAARPTAQNFGAQNLDRTGDLLITSETLLPTELPGLNTITLP